MSTVDASSVRGIPNAAVPLEGLITAGQPTREQLEALAAAGVRTVIDLRSTAEDRGFDESAAVRAAGMVYHPVPVTAATIGAATFDAVRGALRDALCDVPARSTLLHCASANRVGAVLIPYLVLDAGRTPDDALQVAHEVGLRSDDLAERAFAYVAAHRGPHDAPR